MKLVQQTVTRREDRRLTTGVGRYVGDLQRPGLLRAAFVRSPQAHARIIAIDIAAALGADGVVAIYTGEDLAAAGVLRMPGGIRHPRPDGLPRPKTDRDALARGLVRYTGEAVAVVIAETREQALAAAELVQIDYDELPVVGDIAAALAAGANRVWDCIDDNIGFVWRGGNAEATDAALLAAAHVTRLDSGISRVSANPIEPRAFMAETSPDGHLIVHASHQSPFRLRDGLVAVGFADVQVLIGDVGGSFGMKNALQPEAVVVAHAARMLRRPVMWESSRNEAFLSDEHARESTATVEIGFDADCRIVALRAHVSLNIGTYLTTPSGSSINNIGTIVGVYDIPAADVEMCGVFTNTSPVAPYRGAGRPEATYLIERILDVAARELGLSPFELRRRNLIPASSMPHQTALTFTYDSGEFEANMDAAAEFAELSAFAARREEAAQRGRLLGLGICNCIEVSGGPAYRPPLDFARLSLLPDGNLVVDTGTSSVGQGHETAFPQLVADRFGLPVDRVRFNLGDTARLPGGRGNSGSGGLSVGGPALANATEALISSLTEIVAALLDTAGDAVSLEDGGLFRDRDGNRSMQLSEIAATLPAGDDGWVATAVGTFAPQAVTFPNGTHVAEIEIDPDTGEIALKRYSAVEDVGQILNPALVEGQIHGGIAQGVGQALGELVIYDEAGQLLTGSFMDYQMPRAADFPQFRLEHRHVPTSVNPFGVKGVGEAGTVGALSATLNAVNDALAPLGVRHLDMPATPFRIWSAIRAAKSKSQ